MTVYAYFDSEPLPLPATTASAAAQNNNNNNQLHAMEGRDKNKKGGSVLSSWTGNSVGNVVSAGTTFRQKMARALSNNIIISLTSPVTPTDGAKVSVPMTASQAPATTTTLGKLVVVVTDDGAGISAENQQRLFKEVRCHFPSSCVVIVTVPCVFLRFVSFALHVILDHNSSRSLSFLFVWFCWCHQHNDR